MLTFPCPKSLRLRTLLREQRVIPKNEAKSEMRYEIVNKAYPLFQNVHIAIMKNA